MESKEPMFTDDEILVMRDFYGRNVREFDYRAFPGGDDQKKLESRGLLLGKLSSEMEPALLKIDVLTGAREAFHRTMLMHKAIARSPELGNAQDQNREYCKTI